MALYVTLFLQLLHGLTGYLELPKPNKSILYKLLKAIINTLGIKSEVRKKSTFHIASYRGIIVRIHRCILRHKVFIVLIYGL